MVGPAGEEIEYDLYRDAARKVEWWDDPYEDTVFGAGSGATQELKVYGRVYSQEDAEVGPGVYTDTVTVSLIY